MTLNTVRGAAQRAESQRSGGPSGSAPDAPDAGGDDARHVPRYLLHHRHAPHECGVAFASFRGVTSPLRGRSVPASCRWGGHELWLVVDAESEDAARRGLPFFVAQRTTVIRVNDVVIP